MLKKRLILIILLIFSFGILTSCSDVEYIELGLSEYAGTDEIINPFSDPLKLGLIAKYEFNENIDVDLFYGMNEYTTEAMYNGLFEERSDFEQLVNFKIIKKYYLRNEWSIDVDLDVKEVYSINVKLGDILKTSDYIFSLDNKVVDKLDYDSLVNVTNEKDKLYINYIAEIRPIDDEYIKCILTPESYNEETKEYYPDYSKSYYPIGGKYIKSKPLNLRVIFEDNKFKVVYP